MIGMVLARSSCKGTNACSFQSISVKPPPRLQATNQRTGEDGRKNQVRVMVIPAMRRSSPSITSRTQGGLVVQVKSKGRSNHTKARKLSSGCAFYAFTGSLAFGALAPDSIPLMLKPSSKSGHHTPRT